MTTHLTNHARRQIQGRTEGLAYDKRTGDLLGKVRQVVSEDQVNAAIEKNLQRIRRSQAAEVRVIVREFKVQVVCADGSNGDVVLACVDPRTVTVKTVMLQRSTQVAHKIRTGEDAEYI